MKSERLTQGSSTPCPSRSQDRDPPQGPVCRLCEQSWGSRSTWAWLRGERRVRGLGAPAPAQSALAGAAFRPAPFRRKCGVRTQRAWHSPDSQDRESTLPDTHTEVLSKPGAQRTPRSTGRGRGGVGMRQVGRAGLQLETKPRPQNSEWWLLRFCPGKRPPGNPLFTLKNQNRRSSK